MTTLSGTNAAAAPADGRHVATHISDALATSTHFTTNARTAGPHVVGGLAPEVGAVVDVQPEQIACGDVLHAKVAHDPLRHGALARSLRVYTAQEAARLSFVNEWPRLAARHPSVRSTHRGAKDNQVLGLGGGRRGSQTPFCPGDAKKSYSSCQNIVMGNER